MLRYVLILMLGATFVEQPDALANLLPFGPEFQVNTYTTGPQGFVDGSRVVATDEDGNTFVVWASDTSDGPDQNFSIQGQRYDSAGAPAGSEFQVNTYTTGFQGVPSVAADPAGNFIVVWTSQGGVGPDDSDSSIQARRFDSSGSPLGGQFQVNTYTTGQQTYPGVVTDGGGNFVVVWASYGSDDTDTSWDCIQAQRFDSTGAPLGGQFQVNTYTTGTQTFPSVAGDSAGNFVVVWPSAGSLGTDTSNLSVQGQRFDSTGTPQGSEFQVNTYTTAQQAYPMVATDGDGNFVVVWTSSGSLGSDNDDSSIQGQRFDDTGAPQGGEFQVNSHTTGSQYTSSVAAESGGDFVVMWTSDGSVGSDSGPSIQGQHFDAIGTALGDQFQVNTYTTGSQSYPVVSGTSDGTFTVVWQSWGSAGSDTDRSIQGQRFLAPRASTSCGPMGCALMGSVETQDAVGSVNLVVPPGAMAIPTTIQLFKKPASEFGIGTGARSVLIGEFEPDGLAFSLPVTAIFGWADVDANGFVDAKEGICSVSAASCHTASDCPGLETCDVVNTGMAEGDLAVWKDGVQVAPPCDAGGQVNCPSLPCCDPVANTWTVALNSFSEIVLAAEPEKVGVVGTKLVVVDNLVAASKAKVVLVAKDGSITKGTGTNAATIGVRVQLVYGNDSAAGAFVLPAGDAGWLVNKETVGKFVNKSAPSGTTQAKVFMLKPGKLAKLVGRGLGDTAFDILAAGNPFGGIYTAFCVANGDQEFCHCTEFEQAGCTYKPISADTGAKLVCKGGVADPTCVAVGP